MKQYQIDRIKDLMESRGVTIKEHALKAQEMVFQNPLKFNVV
jgi:hypothetical protein